MHQIMNTNYAHVEHLHAGHPPAVATWKLKSKMRQAGGAALPANKLMASYGAPFLGIGSVWFGSVRMVLEQWWWHWAGTPVGNPSNKSNHMHATLATGRN